MNIMFLYKDKTLRTPTLSGTILPGITRDTIITLSKSLGYNVIEDQLDINQILHDINSNKIIEAFAVGTGAVVAPIGKLFIKTVNILLIIKKLVKMPSRYSTNLLIYNMELLKRIMDG